MTSAEVLTRPLSLLGYHAMNVECCYFIGVAWVVIVVGDGKWVERLLECDVVTVMWRGETIQVKWWLMLVWDGKWTVRLLQRDVVTGMWRGETIQVKWWLLLV